MNSAKKKLLIRIGVMVMLVVLAVSFIIVPIFAATETSVSQSQSSTEPPAANVTPDPNTTQSPNANSPSTSNTSTGNSTSTGSGSSSTPLPAEPSGAPYVTGYTVTDSAGNEIQKVAAGQKCTIIISVFDPRLTTAKFPTVGSLPQANFKITTTGSYSPPTFGDINVLSVKGENLKENGTIITLVLRDITYLGGDNTLGLDLAYSDNGRSLSSISQKISQCTDNSQDSGAPSTLLITNASYGNEAIVAGSEFTLTATIRAAGGSAGAKNVSIALTLPEQITVSSGSPNVFVGDIGADVEKTISFKLIASAVANAGSYAVSINASGTQSGKDVAPNATMPVTIPISQPERFEISRFNLSEYMAVGEDNYATVALINKGKGAIYNVSAEITGDGIECPEGKLFIGNIAAGTENNSDITIRATTAGSHKATLVVTYEDDKAVEKTLTKEITITVEDMSGGNVGGDIGMMPPPDIGANGGMEPVKSGMPWWAWLLIIAGVLGVAAVIIIILKKKKAKKIAEQLMEDDDETI